MKKLNQKLTEFIKKHWLGSYVAVMLVIPGIVNGLMYLSIPTLPDLNAPSWLDFWGGYLGSAIGCLPAIAAYLHTIDESKRQHQEFQEQLQESRKQAGGQYGNMEKDRHLSHLPVIDNHLTHINSTNDFSPVHSSSTHILLEQNYGASGYSIQTPSLTLINKILKRELHDIVLLNIRNVGHGPALAVYLHFAESSFSLGTLAEQESCMILLCLNRTNERRYHLEFSFSDMLDWNYRQSHDFLLGIERPFLSPINPPERVE